MIALYTLAVLSPWILWILFTAVMRLQMVRDEGKLTKAQKVFGYPALAVGLLLDFSLQVTLASVMFLEVPKELTVSARLWRWSNSGPSWRQKLALAIRTGLLDSIDPRGIHT